MTKLIKINGIKNTLTSIFALCGFLMIQSNSSYATNRERTLGSSRNTKAVPQKHVSQVGDLRSESRSKLILAALLGYDMISSGNQTAETPALGVSVSVAMTPIWTLGLSFTTVNSTSPDLALSGGATSTMNFLTPHIEYHFPGLEAMFLGVKGGAVMRSSSFTTPLAGSSNKFYFAYGPFAGWDFRLSKALSLAPQVGFTSVVAPVPISDMNIQLGVRYWPQ